VWELDEALRSGMGTVPGVAGSPDDEDKFKAKLASFEAEAVVDA
jgi:hypothetical protein